MQVKEQEEVGLCPTCGKPFSQEQARDEDKKRISQLENEIGRLREELAAIWG